jgi:eukaryotic-like serine/threonine-protein kinase
MKPHFFLSFCLAASTAFAQTPPEGMVLVPGGEFTMGSPRGDMRGGHDIRLFGDAQPVRKVNVPSFFIDKTEVTNAQYKKFCDATGYPPPPHWKNGKFPDNEGNFAVTHVNWWEAKAYASWAGKRLPTEEEWEKAARGTDGRSYPWGETWNPAFAVTRAPKAQEVGTKPDGASPYGALDMAGNAFEWVADWYMAYPGATENFPEFGKNFKVLRGGGFDGSLGFPPMYNTAYRSVSRPQTRSEWVGFRCAKDAK